MLPEPTPAAGEFDPTELQGGLLMQVENVHQPVLTHPDMFVDRGNPWLKSGLPKMLVTRHTEAKVGHSRTDRPRRLIG